MAGSGDERSEYLIVGRIRRPHGVRGELLIAVDTDRPKAAFKRGRTLYLADSRGEPTGRRFEIQNLRPTTGGAILNLTGVASREDAEALRGHSLLIPAGDAAPADADEVHYRDLIGLTVRTADTEVGRVDDILALPAGETLIVRTTGGKEILVPFVKELVVDVDRDRRVLTIDPPEGLLEL